MSGIIYIMGKSATGKDTVYRQIKKDFPELKPIVLYTTRPKRARETDGVEYHFIDEETLNEFAANGKVIEQRTYQTIYGPWHYATIDDGTVDLTAPGNFYAAIGTLEAYVKIKEYYGEEALVPIYIYADDQTRLLRSIRRESKEAEPDYRELCRRYLADEEDFSEEKLNAAGLDESRRYRKDDMEVDYPRIKDAITKAMKDK